MNNKAYEFDEIADGPFFPIYKVIAEQIKERTGVTEGTCLDIGCGGGHLGLSLAQMTELSVILLDVSEDALRIADKRIEKWGLSRRASTVHGDVHRLPLENDSVELCISRGSVWFWEDQAQAFKEIYRVLAHGGMAYIGGGFGSKELTEQIYAKMRERDGEWSARRQKFVEGNTIEMFMRVLSDAEISNFDITDDEKGIWVVIRKAGLNNRITDVADEELCEQGAAPKPDFLGYTYCPLKGTFRECFDEALKKYIADMKDDSFTFYVPSGCGEEDDPYRDIWQAKTIEELPDIVASVGFGDFFRQEFVDRFVSKGYFQAPALHKAGDVFEAAGLIDPSGFYTVYSVFPLVLLIDKKKLGRLPVPHEWKDLLNPVYANNITVGGSRKGIYEDLLIYLYKDHGEEGLAKLAPNIKHVWHASQMAKAAGTNGSDSAAIYVIPWMFSKLCPRTESTEIVWPADGALTTPNYMLVKKTVKAEYNVFADFVMGQNYGQKSAKQYFPALHEDVDNKLPAGASFKWLGWDYIRSHSMDTLQEHVLNIFNRHWRRETEQIHS